MVLKWEYFSELLEILVAAGLEFRLMTVVRILVGPSLKRYTLFRLLLFRLGSRSCWLQSASPREEDWPVVHDTH